MEDGEECEPQLQRHMCKCLTCSRGKCTSGCLRCCRRPPQGADSRTQRLPDSVCRSSCRCRRRRRQRSRRHRGRLPDSTRRRLFIIIISIIIIVVVVVNVVIAAAAAAAASSPTPPAFGFPPRLVRGLSGGGVGGVPPLPPPLPLQTPPFPLACPRPCWHSAPPKACEGSFGRGSGRGSGKAPPDTAAALLAFGLPPKASGRSFGRVRGSS
jgi:hypothetical protein